MSTTEIKELPDAVKAIHAQCIEEGDCMLWTGRTNGCGHPKLSRQPARRVVWEAVNGPIPAGKMVTTSCRDVACLEPTHLVLTTKSEVSLINNACTATRLKRSATAARTARAKFGKITMAIAREIRSSDKTGRDWAKELGVSVSLVSLVRQNKSWVEHSSPWAGLLT